MDKEQLSESWNFESSFRKKIKQKKCILTVKKQIRLSPYKRYNKIASLIHWEQCGRCNLERADKWHERQVEEVIGNEMVKFLWSVTMKYDHHRETRRPDIFIIETR